MSTSLRWAAAAFCLLAAGHAAFAVKVQFQSDPAGATVEIVGPAESLRRLKVTSAVTPAELDLPRTNVPFEIVFRKPGFETVQTTVLTRQGNTTVRQALEPLVIDKTIAIESEPAGAEIHVDGALAGRTPLSQTFRFERANSRAPWKQFSLRAHRDEYQDEEAKLVLNEGAAAAGKLGFTLGRIAEDRAVEVTALDEQGKTIPHAEIYLDGQAAGATDERGVGRVTVPFRRRDKNASWPEFTLTLAVRNEYDPVMKRIAVTTPLKQEYRLFPVTEVVIKRYFPSTEMTSRGPRIHMDVTESLGILNDRDLNSPAIDLRVITSFDRRQTTLQALNSFAVTSDGQNIVYAVTAAAEDGKPFSNLFLKNVQSAKSPVTQLTRGTRFLDCHPAMSGEEGSTLVVFQSDRGVPDTWDISAVRVDNGRVIGGVQQLTRDPQFNYGPALASEQQPVYFSTIEQLPGSLPRVSSVRVDGSTLTNYGETGERINAGAAGVLRLYFTRPDAQSGRQQIYSLAIDGLAFSTVINDEQFSQANCSWPALSPSADMLLFVSDYVADEKGRKNNNVFLWDLRRGGVTQLTDNGSDDLMPRWSPTEPGVIYFLSNRGGAYNVWRMSFRLAQ